MAGKVILSAVLLLAVVHHQCVAAKSNAVKKRLFNLDFHNATFTFDPEVAHAESQVVEFDGRHHLDMNITIMKLIPKEQGFIHSKVMLVNKKKGTSSRTLVPGKRINLCEIANKPKLDPFLSKYLRNFARYTDIMVQCPIPVGLYTIKDLQFDTTLLPSFTPFGHFISQITLSVFNGTDYLSALAITMTMEITAAT